MLMAHAAAPNAGGSSAGTSSRESVSPHSEAAIQAAAAAQQSAILEEQKMTAQSVEPTIHDPSAQHTNVPGVAGNGQQYSVEYLSQLLKDKKQLAAFPNVFHHLERLADEEISKVRVALFQFEFAKGDMALPEPEGDVVVTTEKVFVPAKDHPDYNFVGRILGPRGMTAKQLEQETGCKIMVRGRGSMRDKKKEELNRGKPNWEHLNEELHVLIQVEDTPNRSRVKLARAVEEVKKLLVPAPEGEDDLKRKQLMELAIINGTYRSASQQNAAVAAQLAAAKHNGVAAAIQAAMAAQGQRGLLPLQLAGHAGQIRSPTLAGAPIIMSPSTRSAAGSQAQAAAQMIALGQQQAAALSAAQGQQAPTSGSPVALLAAQQAALLQQQQAAAGLSAVDYQQLLLNQQAASMGYDAQTIQAMQYARQSQQQAQQAASLGYDAQTLQAMQFASQQAQAQQVAQSYSGMLGQYVSADYAQELAAAQSAPGAIMQQRRVLGSSREHPYKQ